MLIPRQSPGVTYRGLGVGSDFLYRPGAQSMQIPTSEPYYPVSAPIAPTGNNIYNESGVEGSF